MRRRAEFVAAFVRHSEWPVRSILDVGCGLGLMKRALAEQFSARDTPGSRSAATSAIATGWVHGSADTYAPDRPFDLVICYDVLQYLDDLLPSAPCATCRGSAAVCCILGRLTHGGLAAALRPPAHGPRRPPATRRLVSPASRPRASSMPGRHVRAPRRADPPVELERAAALSPVALKAGPVQSGALPRNRPGRCQRSIEIQRRRSADAAGGLSLEPRLREHRGRVPDTPSTGSRLQLPGNLSQSERMQPLVIPPVPANPQKLDPAPRVPRRAAAVFRAQELGFGCRDGRGCRRRPGPRRGMGARCRPSWRCTRLRSRRPVRRGPPSFSSSAASRSPPAGCPPPSFRRCPGHRAGRRSPDGHVRAAIRRRSGAQGARPGLREGGNWRIVSERTLEAL